MAAKVTFEGLSELREALRNLPRALAGEAAGIVTRAATSAKSDVVAGYNAHRRSGDLADHVTLKTNHEGEFGTSLTLKSGSKLASIFENGTQARHTTLGWNRGSMPPAHIFVPAVVRRRRTMYAELKAMVADKGLIVTGDA